MCSTSELLICWGPLSAGGPLSSCRARRHHAGSRAIFHAWHDRCSWRQAAIRRRASCRSPRQRRYSTPSSSRDGGVEWLLLRSLRGARLLTVLTPPVMWCNPDDERCAHADNAGDSTPAAFLNEPTAMVACRRGGGGRRPSATTMGTRLAMGFSFSSASVMCKRLGLRWHRPSHATEYGTSSRVGVVPVGAVPGAPH